MKRCTLKKEENILLKISIQVSSPSNWDRPIRPGPQLITYKLGAGDCVLYFFRLSDYLPVPGLGFTEGLLGFSLVPGFSGFSGLEVSLFLALVSETI